MTVITGALGLVDGQSTVRNWSITKTAALQKFVASNTFGGAGRRRGVKDWSGSFSAYGGVPNVMPTGTFAFKGATGSGLHYDGNAMVDSVVITWSFESGAPLSYVVNFGGMGALTTSSSALSDLTDPDVPDIDACKVEFYLPGEDPDEDAVDLCVSQLTLTLSAENQTYVNSCTEGWTSRKAGTRDWTIALTMQEDAPFTALGDVNTDIGIKLWIDDTNYYLLEWGKIRDLSGFTVDRESGAIITATMNVDMNCFVEGESFGRILLPGEVTPLWP